VTAALAAEQALNGLQLGLMLFLMAAGLTLVLGIMDTINLAHGSLYMTGAYLAAAVYAAAGSFLVAVVAAVAGTALIGALLEMTVLRALYRRDHLSQVLATFAIILIANETIRMIWGPQPVALPTPRALSGPVELLPGFLYPAWRLVLIAAGLGVAVLLFILVTYTRAGMRVRAGASNREMAEVMGVDVKRLFTVVFAIGAALCALAGALLGPLLAVQVGMGESILIPAFVVVVIGGIGSIRGAFVGALLVGIVDTAGRALLFPALASIAIYVLMAAVLFWKPQGLFPARG
jgi:branched-chain amino acid transport system permease protein